MPKPLLHRASSAIVAFRKPIAPPPEKYPSDDRNHDHDSDLGSCRKCSQPIALPGLDADFCQQCGWVINPIWLAENPPKPPREGKKSKKKRSADPPPDEGEQIEIDGFLYGIEEGES